MTAEFHADAIEAQVTQAPGVKVVCPAFPDDVRCLLPGAIRDPDPVLFLEPQRPYRSVRRDVHEGDQTVPLGKARVVRDGDDVTTLATGD